jgi:class 3 adenylate cyclase/tetratricopeptide (TPR) repeat protein
MAYFPHVVVCPQCAEENPERARFCHACGTQLASTPSEARKMVTVLFCDVMGSTSLGEQQDPEQLRRIMSRYYEEVRVVLEHHGGRVEKFIGDAVMAVFGVPAMHEDDALRALRAAVELRKALTRLNDELEQTLGVRLHVRTGVNTGDVVVGGADGTDSFVFGSAVNVAQRLEAAAAPAEILIGEETYRLARDAVFAEPVAPLELKGKQGRVPAYRVLDVLPRAVSHMRWLDSPLVGRDRELALLRNAFVHVITHGTCHLFTVLGAAGVGKSRLVAEALSEIEPRGKVLSASCLPYGDGITFWPVLELVKESAGIADDDPSDVARTKIAVQLEGEEAAERAAERLAELMGLGEAHTLGEEGFWAARKLFEALARRQPLVVLLDDLHWAEPTLLDLIDYVADWARDASILLVCMARPELLDGRPNWGGGKLNATTIFLEPLSEHESQRLIDNLLGRATLPSAVSARIRDAAEGNPLFVEEMLSMLIDDGLLRRQNGGWAPVGDLSQVPVPPSIKVLLASRLDRLGIDERRVIERAAIEGKTFHRGAVEALLPNELRERVGERLLALVRKDLIRPQRAVLAGEEEFRFRHVLIREAAYESLSKAVRADLHERFADWLQALAGERTAEYEELLGYHLEQAFLYSAELARVDDRVRRIGLRAGERLATAGRRALARGDVSASVNLLSRAAAVLPDDDENKLTLLPELGVALRESGDLARAEAVLRDAVERAELAPNRIVELSARTERAALHLLSAPSATETDALVAEVEAALPDLEQLGVDRVLARALTLIALTRGLWKGRFAGGEETLARALTHARKAGDRRQEATILGHLALSALSGPMPVPEGVRRCEQILELAEGDRLIEASTARYLACLEARRGEFERARDLVARARETYGELGMRLTAEAAGALASGDIELLAGDDTAAERALRAGYLALAQMGERGYLSTLAALLAAALYGQNALDEAEKLALRAQDQAAQDDIWSQVISRGTRAKVLALRDSPAEADALAREAVRLVEDTDALDLHGRALLDLAEVLRVAGRSSEAATAADQALRLFTEKGNVVLAGRAEALRDHVR